MQSHRMFLLRVQANVDIMVMKSIEVPGPVDDGISF